MSQQQQKIYVPRSIVREKSFQNGGSIMTIGLHADETAAFLKQHANANGWVNLVISSNRNVGRHGQTHSLALDTFEPNKDRGADVQQKPTHTQPPRSQHVRTTTAANVTPQDDGSDVPF